jgi:hypothetical protein
VQNTLSLPDASAGRSRLPALEEEVATLHHAAAQEQKKSVA